ncbi:DNA polymerase III subunit alpha [Spiroplasma endosymbiont of Aspidapion aeneum]|uniref:DNA polymerase III subunit alpha n=1 Tax=Spiroplasma endosymbiont of Aspidapion aeneum TaxID=3066276 RepID=UPI00313F294B
MNLPNVKTSYNFLKSLISINDYIEFAKQNNFEAVFLTDELYMYGVCEFVIKAKDNNIKSIIGFSLSFSNCEILIYAKNKNGFKQCCSLSNYFQSLQNYRYDKVENHIIKILTDTNECYIIFTPYNISSFNCFNKIIHEFDCSYIYGLCKKNINLIKQFETNYIWSNRINYLSPNDGDCYKAIRAIDKNVLYDDISIKEESHFLNREELSPFINHKIHEQNMKRIISIVDFDIFNEKENNFVKFNDLNIENFFRQKSQEKIDLMIKEGTIDKNIREKYISRIDYELRIISDLKFLEYFYVVYDFIEFSNKNNILIGPGRGSAAGSLLSFCLDITIVDPIKYDLLFERFLNKDRATKPDIDVDIQDDRREEVINYLYKKYGKEHFANIVTFQNIGIRQALRDCSRIFPNEKNIIEFIVKKSKSTDYKQFDNDLKNVKEWELFKKENKLIISIIEKIVGLPRQTSTHASGVVFSYKKLIDIIPVKTTFDSIMQTQVPMDYIEKFGLIKMDILGLKNLTILNEILKTENIGRHDLLKIPLDNKEAYTIFQKSDTEGIFQFESSGIKNVLSQINPINIQEISDASALFRPGPQKYIEIYVRNKANKDTIKFLNDELRNILFPTYNVIVYQEQLMKLLQVVANFTLNDADIIRRSISKKNIELMNKYKDKFIRGGQYNNYSSDDIESIWQMILEFADYGFNKSHAICYALVSYWLAYYKANKPELFYIVQLNHLSPGDEKYKKYIYEIKNKKIDFEKPNINKLSPIFALNQKNIVIPISAIKNISRSFTDKICSIKIEKTSILNTIKKMQEFYIDINILRSLFAVGYFDSYGYPRKQLIHMVEKFFILSKITREFEIEVINDFVDSSSYISMLEEEYLGFTITGDLFLEFREQNKNIDTISFLEGKNASSAQIFGVVKYVREIKTKHGDLMAFVNLFDGTGSIDFTIFPEDYKLCKSKIIEKKLVILNIKRNIYKDQEKFILANKDVKNVIIEKKDKIWF